MSPTVDVGLFEIGPDSDTDLLLAGVTADEGEHYRCLLHRPQRARQYLASRWLLRAHLARATGLQPTDIAIRYPADAPPVIARPSHKPGLQLSLSHSGNLCLCASTTAARIGCDAEWHRPRPRLRAIAEQYFHPAEAAYLNRLDDNRARAEFYRLWTLKEATQKALGLGLAGGLRVPAFAQHPQLRCIEQPPGQNSTFATHTLNRPSGRYSLALAVAGPGTGTVATHINANGYVLSKHSMARHHHWS